MRNGRSLIGLLVALALVAFIWWTQGDDAAKDRADGESTPTASVTPTPEVTGGAPGESESGTSDEGDLPSVPLSDLPPEAAETLDLIDAGGPFPHDRDGVTFENREDLLPQQPSGYYREYTVETPGSDDRGARRIVTGDRGELYWTDDHYASFSTITR